MKVPYKALYNCEDIVGEVPLINIEDFKVKVAKIEDGMKYNIYYKDQYIGTEDVISGITLLGLDTINELVEKYKKEELSEEVLIDRSLLFGRIGGKFTRLRILEVKKELADKKLKWWRRLG